MDSFVWFPLPNIFHCTLMYQFFIRYSKHVEYASLQKSFWGSLTAVIKNSGRDFTKYVVYWKLRKPIRSSKFFAGSEYRSDTIRLTLPILVSLVLSKCQTQKYDWTRSTDLIAEKWARSLSVKKFWSQLRTPYWWSVQKLDQWFCHGSVSSWYGRLDK